MVPYLQSEGKFLTTAMPLQSLSPAALVHSIQNHPGHRNKTQSETGKMSPVSCKPKPMVHLTSRTQVRLPPKMLSVVPVKVMKPPGAVKLRNLDITGYPNFYLEHPTISVLPTTHTKVNKNKAGYLVLLLSNTGNEVVVIEKASTITLGIKSQWKVWSQKVWSKSKPPPRKDTR